MIVVAAIDRIGRNAVSTLEVVEDLKAKGITLISLREGFDATTPAGKLMLTMLAGIAEMERTSMLERQRAGIDSAKKRGQAPWQADKGHAGDTQKDSGEAGDRHTCCTYRQRFEHWPSQCVPRVQRGELRATGQTGKAWPV